MRDDPTVCLDAFIDLVTGYPFKSSDYSSDDSGIRLLRGDNIAQGRLRWEGVKLWPIELAVGHEEYELAHGDVVLAMDRPWIEAGLKHASVRGLDLPALLVQRVARLRAGPGLDQGFLRYIIGSAEFTQHVQAVQTGTAVPHISPSQIREFRFKLPPLSEQHAIADVLGALDDKIEANRSLSSLLEARLEALFSAAKFDGDDIRPVKLIELFEVNPTRPRPSSGEAPYIDMASLPTDAALVPSAQYRIAKSGTRFVNGDTVMARITPCLENGKVAFIDCLPIGLTGVGSTEFIVLRPRDPLPAQFAYFLVRSQRFADFAVRHMSGSSGRQRCPTEAVARFEISRPELSLLASFAREANPAFAAMRAALDESLVLVVLRNTLLPKLLSGQVRVRDASELVHESV